MWLLVQSLMFNVELVQVIPVTRVSDMMVGAVNQKQTPSSLPPNSMFLSEVTSMADRGVLVEYFLGLLSLTCTLL